jgi:hypothetical protein
VKTPNTVSRLPIKKLWKEPEWLPALRDRFLTTNEAKILIKDDKVSVVIASIMSPIYWPINRERFKNWKSIKPLLLDGTNEKWITGSHQFYIASIWHSEATDYLLFEHYH